MASLDCCPGFALPLLLFRCVAALIAYGGGVYQQVGTCECHQAGSLRIPLVPAHKHSEAPHAGVDGVESEVARREVELLVIGRVVGDMHFAVFPGNASVAIYHHCCVVVESWCATLEEGCHDDNSQLTCEVAEIFCRWTGDGLCQIEQIDIFHLAEIQ